MDEEKYVNFDEMPEPVSVENEITRIQLTELGQALISRKVSCDLINDEEDGDYILLVPIDGPENMNLALTLLLDADYHMTLSALYRSDVLGETVFETAELPNVPDYGDIAENFVIPLAEEIFIAEHERIAANADINDNNTEEA